MVNKEITIIDYGIGNIGSITNMIHKAGGNSIITCDKEAILNSKKILLPGVGSFDSGMRNLIDKGLVDVIKEYLVTNDNYLFGICLGMQLLFEKSEEGSLNGLGLIKGDVRKFDHKNPALKIPHMGWNTIDVKINSPLLESLSNSRFYFVHSFHVNCQYDKDILATTEYGLNFPSIVNNNNVFGAQFHPEKSHRFGLRMFQNFLNI